MSKMPRNKVLVLNIKIYSSNLFRISNKNFRCCLIKKKRNTKTSVTRSATFSFSSPKLAPLTLQVFPFISQTGFDMSILIHFFSLTLQIISSTVVVKYEDNKSQAKNEILEFRVTIKTLPYRIL